VQGRSFFALKDQVLLLKHELLGSPLVTLLVKKIGLDPNLPVAFQNLMQIVFRLFSRNRRVRVPGQNLDLLESAMQLKLLSNQVVNSKHEDYNQSSD